MVKVIWTLLDPDNINVDYESSIYQALGMIFLQSSINGCFFHLILNLRKHLDLILMCNSVLLKND